MKTESAGAQPALTDRQALAEECKRLVADYAHSVFNGYRVAAPTVRKRLHAAIDRLAAALPQPPAIDAEASADRNWIAGAQWGFARGQHDNHEALDAAIEARLRDLRESQAVASLPASSLVPPKSDVHFAVQEGDVSGAAASLRRSLTSDEQYWLRIRPDVIKALADDGLEIVSDKDRVWLHRMRGSLHTELKHCVAECAGMLSAMADVLGGREKASIGALKAVKAQHGKCLVLLSKASERNLEAADQEVSR
jgi:hypothetical protein